MCVCVCVCVCVCACVYPCVRACGMVVVVDFVGVHVCDCDCVSLSFSDKWISGPAMCQTAEQRHAALQGPLSPVSGSL